MIYPAPWTNLVLSFFRMFAVLAGTAMMFSARFRAYLKTYPQEAYFAAFISSRYLLRLSDMGAWQFYPLFDPGTFRLCSTPSSGGCQKTGRSHGFWPWLRRYWPLVRRSGFEMV